MKTYNVNDNIAFTQDGMTLYGTITKVIKIEADGSGYYQVTYGKYGSKTIVATEEIEEGRFSVNVTFVNDNGERRMVGLCSAEEAMAYLYDVVYANGWTLISMKRGYTYND